VKGAWTEEEEYSLVRALIKHGTHWKKIEESLSHRAANTIKTRWNTALHSRKGSNFLSLYAGLVDQGAPHSDAIFAVAEKLLVSQQHVQPMAETQQRTKRNAAPAAPECGVAKRQRSSEFEQQ
jgi:hypothetical protein